MWGVGVTAHPLIGRSASRPVAAASPSTPNWRSPACRAPWSAGNAAAVPDLAARSGDVDVPDTPPTAQHAQRQGKVLGRNVAADLGVGTAKRYRHKGLGLVADLGGWDAVAKPLGVPLTGPPAKVVTRAYHLYALPAMANRVRVAADWLFQTVLPPESTQLSVVRPEDARLAWAQGTTHPGGRAQPGLTFPPSATPWPSRRPRRGGSTP